MERIALKNGHILTINNVGFVLSLGLFKVICRELKQADIDLAGIKDVKDLLDLDPTFIKDGVLQLLGSDKLEQQLFDIMAKCTLQAGDESKAQAISRETFNPPDMRPDFFPVAWEVIKANVVPFFANLDFASFTPKNRNTPDQP